MNPFASLALKLLPWAAVFLMGVAAAEFHEHKAPWGLEARRLGLLKELGEWRDASDAWQKNRDGWYNYAKRLEAARTERNDDAADDVGRCTAAQGALTKQAFDNGYFAGRVAGRKSCGATNATPDPAGMPGDRGLQPDGPTLSRDWAGRAYQAPGALPTHR